jgi:AraC-like DNA-binding protein
VARFRRIEALYPDRKLPCFDPAREEYRRHPAAAEAAARQGDVVDRFEASSLLALLVAPFLRTARVHEGMHARVTDRFLAVQQVIHSRMGEPLRLADLARAAGLHPTYFSDRFREVVGVRPLEYLTRRRLERAQDLLLSSTASVKQVAAEVGIPDAAYFTRVFSRLYQMSPTRFRDSHGT